MNRKPFLFNGMVMMIISTIGICYSDYLYGNHSAVATSTPEAISDLTFLMFFSVGAILYTIGRSLPKNPS